MKRRILIPLLAGVWLIVAFIPAFAGSPGMAKPMETSRFPSLESAIRITGPLTFCGESVPLHLPEVRERLEKEMLLMLWDRAQVILWAKRTGRYFPHLETVLRGANMPDDLKYIAVIESALRPHAGSNKGARGVWQFIPSTGRNYGLNVSRNVDERRNFYLATRAAVSYLRDLHDMFGAWSLASAAYNMGEMGLKKQIELQEIKDYYKLHLPRETQRYVLRAVAAKLILSNPSRFGFNLTPSDYYEPVPFDRIVLKNGQPAPIAVVAKAAKTHFKAIKDLNPHLLGNTIPRGTHPLFLPQGSAKSFAKRYEPLVAKYRKAHGSKTYVVKRGDNLTVIARRNNMPLWKLLKINNLHTRSTIRPGQKLIVTQ